MTGTRGPRSQSDDARRLTGDAGHRQPRTRASDPGDRTIRTPVDAPAGRSRKPASAKRAPQMPDWLMDEARREWRRIVPLLKEAGRLEESDVPMIAMYCQAWGQYRALDGELAAGKNHTLHCPECGIAVGESAYLVEGARGNLVKTPLWQMWRDAVAQVERLGEQLGLSPKGRLRLPAPPPPPGEKDPLDGLDGGDAGDDDAMGDED